MTTTIRSTAAGTAAVVALIATVTTLLAQSTPGVISGPVGPSPYDIVRGWHQPFSEPGFTFGGNSGVFAESPNRIFVAQRGEYRLPDPVPPGFAGFAGSIGVNVLSATAGRVWKNCLYTLDANGRVKERWTQWDSLCEGSSGPGPHRLRISPYDPEHRVWVVNETFSTIYVFSNDGSKLLKTLGEKNVEGKDGTHFGKPQDVAFLPDGRILIADGLDNHRVMILDRQLNYLGEFGGFGKGPGQFSGVHAIAVGPEGRIFALDRSGGRINVFKTTANPATIDFVEAFAGFSLPLDIIVNDDSLWVTDLNPLRFTKLDFHGNHLYTWMVPKELPDGYLEVHTFTVDSSGILYGGDNQYGRTQKFVPKGGADPKLLIRPPWSASGAASTPARRADAAPGATDWPSTNYDQTANRYSPLTQITKQNVGTLQQVWSVHLKPAGFTGPMREDEAIPIVIGNTMYLASPYGAVIALDATTGVQKWKFQLPNNEIPSKRGVAYWPGGGGGGALPLPPSIVFGSTTGKLYSITAAEGTLNEWFGENGVITLKTPEVMQTGTNVAYSLLSSPTMYKNLIITGAGTGEGPGGSNGGAGPAGDTRAWDARTGKLVWTFHSIPRPGEFGYDTWGGDSAKNRSGVNVWGYTSLDAERGILYMPLGAPNNDRIGIDRPGNNLFSSSVVAVDANTGKYLWHFQLVHHDIWDYDTQSAPLLVDLRRDGQVVPAVIIVNKTGLMFTLNRVTGKPIFAIEERPVPKSDVPGEQASPTQPFPVKPEPLAQNTIARNNLYKGEPQHQSYCEHLVDDNNMKLGGPYMPIAFNQYSISPPGPAGGINFWGPSYDPELHLFVSNTSNIFQPMRIVRREDGSYANAGPLAGTRRFGDPDRKLLCGPTPWGELVAVNMDSGNIAYRKTLGVSDALPPGMQDTGRPSSGGVVLTASGLTFVGGTDDFRFRAFATATGEKLWEMKLPSSVETTPITYLGADGRQFVTVVSTGGGLTGSQVTNDEIIAFALPRR